MAGISKNNDLGVTSQDRSSILTKIFKTILITGLGVFLFLVLILALAQFLPNTVQEKIDKVLSEISTTTTETLVGKQDLKNIPTQDYSGIFQKLTEPEASKEVVAPIFSYNNVNQVVRLNQTSEGSVVNTTEQIETIVTQLLQDEEQKEGLIGPIGPAGLDGLQGPQGPAGERGPAGSSSSSTITVNSNDNFSTTTLTAGTLDATGDVTIGGNLTVSSFGNVTTECLQVDAAGLISTAGAACGVGGGSGDSITVNGAAATDANFINTTATGTVPAVTWALNTGATPDEASITVGVASSTEAGVITTGTQTLAGQKTFANTLTASSLSSVTGSELVTNGTFTGNANGWTLGDCASYGSNQVTVTYTACNDANLTTTISTVAGETYELTFTVTATGDTVYYYFDNNSLNIDDGPYETGTHTVAFTTDFTGTETIYFESWDWNDDATWTLDNVSIREATVTPSLVVEDYKGDVILTLGNSLTDNLGIGINALQGASNTGEKNVAIGGNALMDNTTGFDNVAIGYSALENNTTGFLNTAVGKESMGLSTTGLHNATLGFYTLYSNTSGSYNTALGSYTLSRNTSGNSNIGMGHATLYTNTTGSSNIAIGGSALYANTTGNSNIAIGSAAMQGNTTGILNTAVGNQALWFNTTGQSNVAMGNSALAGDNASLVHTGNYNTSIGDLSMQENLSGGGNTAVGYGAHRENNTGNYNVAIGYQALQNNVSGWQAVAIGTEAGMGVAGLSDDIGQNVLIGYQAGYNIRSTALGNMFIGWRAGDNITTGSRNIVMGYNVDIQSTTANDTLNIGNLIFGTGMTQTTTLSSGSVGIGVVTPSSTKLEVVTTSTGSTTYVAKFTGSTSSGTAGILTTTAGYSQYIARSSTHTDRELRFQVFSDGITYFGPATTSGTVAAHLVIRTAADSGSNTGEIRFAPGGSQAGVFINGGNFGLGDTSPAAMLTVGSGDLFQVNSSGQIAAVRGYTQSTGTMSLTSNNTTGATTSSALAVNANSITSGTGLYVASSTVSSGTLVDIQVNSTAAASNTQTALNVLSTGVNSSTATTWAASIQNTHSGSSSSNVALRLAATSGTNNYALITQGGNVGVGDSTPLSLLTVGSSDAFQVNSSGQIAAVAGYVQGSGTMSVTSANTTQATTSSAFALNVNSLTTGTGMYVASSSLTSGNLVDLQVSGTGALNATQTVLNIATAGANANNGQSTYGMKISNTHTGTTSDNVGLYITASGGTNNYALVTAGGNVGFATTTPTNRLDVMTNGTSGVSNGVTIRSGTNTASNILIRPFANDFGGAIGFNMTFDGTNANRSNTSYEAFNIAHSTSSAAMVFQYAAAGANPLSMSNAIVIDATGEVNVGGDITPDAAFTVGSTSQFQVTSAGALSASTGLATTSADLGDGTAGYVVTLGRNTNATNTGAGSVNFQSKAGTAGYVWQDAAGYLRIHTAAPSNANDTAGTVVGDQTSTRNTKQNIESYTNYAEALNMIVDAPLKTFKYVKDVQGYGADSFLAKTRLGYIADEVPAMFMWGNSIDQVSVNGLLMASVKELNSKIETLQNQTSNLQGSNQLNVSASTPIVLKAHLYLSQDSIGQAKILEGAKKVRVSFAKPYQYQPIVTITPNGRVGSEYWVGNKDATGFTIYIDDASNSDMTFDWHAFAGPEAKLTVSNGLITNISLSVESISESELDNESAPETNSQTDPELVIDESEPEEEQGEVLGDEEVILIEDIDENEINEQEPIISE